MTDKTTNSLPPIMQKMMGRWEKTVEVFDSAAQKLADSIKGKRLLRGETSDDK